MRRNRPIIAFRHCPGCEGAAPAHRFIAGRCDRCTEDAAARDAVRTYAGKGAR